MSWLTWLINLLFGGAKQSTTDQQLGKVEQQKDDATASNKDDERAQQIDTADSGLTDAELAAKLRRP